MTQRHTVVQSEHLAAEAADWLRQRCELVRSPHDGEGFGAALAAADGLVVRTYTIVDEALLDRAPRLRVVGRAGAGLDNIDIAACRRHGVEVVYTPDANTQAVVEYLVGLLIDIVRPRVRVTSALDLANWRWLRQQTTGERQLSDLVLGILGLGRIGKRLAEVAASLGFARVLYHDIVEIPAAHRAGALPVAVEEVFAEGDVVSIHVDGRPGNRGFVGETLIGRMKPQVIFVNTSRGFVVDNVTLAAFLRQHTRAVALLDVHEPEPFESDYPLLGLPNARLYPHIGASTLRADLNMSWVVRDVLAVLEGRPPRHPAPAAGLDEALP
jgi:D-3-phosphoglycerate dehydrogenase